ncbi:hypothetical protein [Foetidibacter luteolus]|uniref:hypothetical protein n=1 Tax=Foetidibacter luteolus TaxID=2608880 RepID=UPI00129A80AB|nr:hypothetical protein [Foetidibacter luteolus]
MASLGKRILSAFVEVTDDEQPVTKPEDAQQVSTTTGTGSPAYAPRSNEKFRAYFDKLFSEANIPGPDYFEFSKMTEAMQSMPDEKTRYTVAFAGLSVQGLDRQKLLATAAQYLQVLDNDAANFDSTVDAALQEKVISKQKEIAAKQQRINDLTREINDLHNQVAVLNNEIKENEEKIESNTGGYKAELEMMRNRILYDIEKIKQLI